LGIVIAGVLKLWFALLAPCGRPGTFPVLGAGSVSSCRAIVIGDSIVRGIDRCYCGCRRDSRVACCLAGARVLDVTEQLQGILKGEGDVVEVMAHLVPMS